MRRRKHANARRFDQGVSLATIGLQDENRDATRPLVPSGPSAERSKPCGPRLPLRIVYKRHRCGKTAPAHAPRAGRMTQEGRSPGSRVTVLSPPSRACAQWLMEKDSPLTVAGAAPERVKRDRSGFPFGRHSPAHLHVTDSKRRSRGGCQCAAWRGGEDSPGVWLSVRRSENPPSNRFQESAAPCARGAPRIRRRIARRAAALRR